MPGVAEYRDSPGLAEYRDKAGLAAGVGLGRAAKLVPGRAAGLALGLEAVSKGNSRVKIEQRRRVQHLEKFRIFQGAGKAKEEGLCFDYIFFFNIFFVFLCTLPKPSTTRGGVKNLS